MTVIKPWTVNIKEENLIHLTSMSFYHPWVFTTTILLDAEKLRLLSIKWNLLFLNHVLMRQKICLTGLVIPPTLDLGEVSVCLCPGRYQTPGFNLVAGFLRKWMKCIHLSNVKVNVPFIGTKLIKNWILFASFTHIKWLHMVSKLTQNKAEK